MPKPEYTESCDNCIHYTEKSYMFGDCEMCQHEVACDAICTQFAERHIEPPEFYRDAETVQIVTERAEPERDAVNHPEHYTQGGIECIDALKSATTGLQGIEAVCTANAIKYLWRWKNKNGVQDVEKAIWYCKRLIKELQNEQ